jgi:hypothetical protein
VAATTSGADASSYTFTSADIGTADADRTVVVAVASRKSGATTTITGVTVGGVSATELVQVSNFATNTCVAGLYAINVASGTSADIVVTFADPMLRCGIGVYRCTGISTTPNDTATSATSGASVNVDVTAGGAAIGVASAGTTSQPACTWTVVGEHYDGRIGAEVSIHSGASAEFASGATVSPSVTIVSPTEPAAAYASW